MYSDLGVKPVINAIGNVSVLGGSTASPAVRAAMERASDSFAPMLAVAENAAQAIAEMLGVEAAWITSGAGSALSLAAAACIAGDDADAIARIPNTAGLPNEILIQKRQRYWYDRCLELAGAKLVEAGTDEGTSEQDVIDAIGENTMAVHFFAHEQDEADPNILPVETIIRIAHEKGVYATVDAAGQIYPLENFGKYVKMGADFQCIAAKYMGAPHSTGMALGTEEMIHLISLQSFTGYETRRIRGIGRPQKMDRQEMVGVVAAVKRWFSMNHEDRLARSEQMSNQLAAPLKGVAGVTVEMNQNIIGHQPFGVFVTVDKATAGMTGEDLVAALKAHEPSIWTRVTDGSDRLTLHVFGLDEGQPEIVGNAIRDIVTRK